ncbi:MAG TPA: ATP-binding cassette domain-containing protein [Acidimicrobiia bacterium]|nr:ATP-binding cassette domain-containing protein [Acidimicrobiia bacterium]
MPARSGVVTGLRRAAGLVAGCVAFLALVQVLWGPPAGIVAQGALLGAVTGLISLGLALVYRANRIVNFAQGDLGAVPAAYAVLLIVASGASWFVAFGAGLVVAVVVGAAVELLVIRRFRHAPRLILSVVTIGVAQVLAGIGLLLPRWFDVGFPPTSFPAPFDASLDIGTVRFGANEVLAAIAVPVAFVALTVFLRSRTGLAIRARAEDADRAATLGIPVRRLDTIVWVIAAVLGFLAVFLRAGIVGLPIGSVLGPAILLRALAAAVIGRMERLFTIALAAIALGIVEQSVVWGWGQRFYVEPVLFVVILVALLVTPPGLGLRSRIEPSTWKAVREPRPIPRALARTTEVRAARIGIVGVLAAVLVVLPALLSPSDINLAAVAVIYALIALSLVVLTGWAGEVSLGQMAFVAIGAAAAGSITSRLGWDLGLALLGGGLVGAAVATLVGLPVLRRRGLTIAVISLAFSLATTAWILNPQVFGPGTLFDWLPDGRIERGDLFGVIDVRSESAFYYLCLVVLGLALVAVTGIRRSRTGRVLVAIRENEDVARAYGVSSRRTTLAAFVVSGFLAALAGALFVHHQNGLIVDSYGAGESLVVFAMVVIGGLGSIPGALVGALYVRGVTWFLPVEWQILATGAGMLVVLLVFPGGLGAALADVRDVLLRRVALHRGVSAAATAFVPASPGAPLAQRASGVTDDVAEAAPAVVVAAPTPTAVQVRGLAVEFDGMSVLDDVDLDVVAGEILGVLGTNGSGKSTLLRAIAGLVTPRSGTVRIDGIDTTRRPPERTAAMGVGLVPGGDGVFPSLTVAQHLQLAARRGARGRAHRREGGRTVDRAIEEALAQFPALRSRQRDVAGDLSGGEQHQLAIAMALVTPPRLLLVDELTLGLAPEAIDRVVGVVRALRDAGTTVVVVEQSVDRALELVDRVCFLDRGVVRYVGAPTGLLDHSELLHPVFLGDAAESAATSPPSATTTQAPIGTREACVTVREVSKHFGGVVALDQVSFTVHAGEIVGLVGGNGAGKTTTFDAITGSVGTDAGTIVFHDRDGARHDITRTPMPTRARLGIGRTFQDGRLFPALTVEETVAVALEHAVRVRDPVAAALHLPAARRSERAVRARVDEILELLHLDAFADRFVHELSTGTRRVVDLGGAIAHDPDLLLLDEPSSGLAQREVETLAPLLLRMRDRGMTLVVIDHHLELLQAIADRFVALQLGRVVADGTPDAVLADPVLADTFLARNR